MPSSLYTCLTLCSKLPPRSRVPIRQSTGQGRVSETRLKASGAAQVRLPGKSPSLGASSYRFPVNLLILDKKRQRKRLHLPRDLR